MGKEATKYLITQPWGITEEGFSKENSKVSESLFSLGNEFMGVRGYFEEGYSGDSLQGSYFNGVYEEATVHASYKGFVKRTAFMINSVDYLYTRIQVEGETLDLNTAKFKNFKRSLSFKDGVLKRSFVWVTKSGKHIYITFERFLSMVEPNHCFQKLIFKSIDFDGEIELKMGLDFSRLHLSHKKNYWNTPKRLVDTDTATTSMLGVTKQSGQKILSAFKVWGADVYTAFSEEMLCGLTFKISLSKGQEKEIVKSVYNQTFKEKAADIEAVWESGNTKAFEILKKVDHELMLKQHIEYWENAWNNSDIVIEGDELTQQGIRFCIFQLYQTYHGGDPSLNIGGKGLTGEAYNGSCFWDTETYCLPFYMFNNPTAAKALITYRYNTLPQAIERAEQLDCSGAFYPITTIDGTECCTPWQHALLQLQASTAVAYAVWHYSKVLDDKVFLYVEGIEMLVQICRMLATRGDFDQITGKYGYYSVMGPDEFQMMVNNNCYTNYIAKMTFKTTCEVLKNMKKEAPVRLGDLKSKVTLLDNELDLWLQLAEKMYIPKNETTGIYEQHDGFFKLPHIDVDKIPVTDFPLYHNWSYDRIYRNDMIKQPDVLMFMFLYSQQFSLDEKAANYLYYEPRCIHESSLSPSVHSILASEIGFHREAYEFFEFATRMDLDNYNRNTNEGLHTTSIAAAWMNIVYGFAGMRSDGEELILNPSIPQKWDSYSFYLTYRGARIKVTVNKENVCLCSDNPVEIVVYGDKCNITHKEFKISIPDNYKSII